MANSEQSPKDTYVAGLTMLARRELSEAQLRQRLARRGHTGDDIDAAVTRLTAERALDDARVAEALARTELTLRGRGQLRVSRQIAQAGIAAETGRRAIARAYEDVDAGDLLESALAKRLRGRPHVADTKEMQRLYRYLVGQGFESDKVLRLLRSRLARDARRDPAED